MPNSKHVSGFSPSGELFSIIDGQGILRIWETETSELKQEFTPNLHLGKPCSALTWVTITTQTRKERNLVRERYYIALGTSNGTVSLYSYAEGKIERNLKGDGHDGKITDIIYDNAEKLYTCGIDCQIIVWSLNDECMLTSWQLGSEKPECLAYMPISRSLVVGSRQIKVFSIEQQQLLQTFTGHSSEINAMCTIVLDSNVEYLATTSIMERIICLWKIGKKVRNKTASATLLMEDIAQCLACQIQKDDIVRVASVTRSGVIHIYLISINSFSSEKPMKPKVTLEIASDRSRIIDSVPAVTVHFDYNTNKPEEILFGYGNSRILVFERLSPNYSEKMNVLLRNDPKKLYSTKKDKDMNADVSTKTAIPIINYSEVEYKTPLPTVKKKLQNEVPMESRLENLNLSVPVPIQSQSKVQLLVQALHSKNAELLRSVLYTKDFKSIQLTLQRLPIQYVGTLVNELTFLMEMKRSNIEFALPWLKELTQAHSSQLLALGVDDLQNKFGPCLGIIQQRASCLNEVYKLSGRLDLLVSQLKRNEKDDKLEDENVLMVNDYGAPNQLKASIPDYNDEMESWSDGDDEQDDNDDREDDDAASNYHMELDV